MYSWRIKFLLTRFSFIFLILHLLFSMRLSSIFFRRHTDLQKQAWRHWCQLDFLISMVDFRHISHVHPVAWQPTHAPTLVSAITSHHHASPWQNKLPFSVTVLLQTGWFLAWEHLTSLFLQASTAIESIELRSCFRIFGRIRQEPEGTNGHRKLWRTQGLRKSFLVW